MKLLGYACNRAKSRIPMTPCPTSSSLYEDLRPNPACRLPGWGRSSSYVRVAVLVLVLVLLCGRCQANGQAQDMIRDMQLKVVNYLSRFGYLSGAERETGNLRSQADLTEAIKRLQEWAQIPVTGVINRRTMELLSRPRCGNPDVVDSNSQMRRRKRYVAAPSQWSRRSLTFRIENYTPDLPLHTIRQDIFDAFKVWSDVSPLVISEVRSGDADMIIQFASRYHHDGYPFDGKGMILAHAFFPGEGRGGDIHFDDDENWTHNSTDGVDLFMVAAHEFGHALGLSHSTDASALMYPWYQGFHKNFRLPRDDIEGIQALYGSKDDPGFTFPTRKPTDQPTYDVNPPSRPSDDDTPPKPCSTSFDAVTVIRSQIVLFIGKWFWRMDSRRILEDAVHINKFWYGLPPNISRVDAVYERPTDGKIVFFSGDRYWLLNGNHLVTGFPTNGRPITELGLPADVRRISTVFVWGYNRRTYVVSGDMYWKLDENNTYVEYDYPRDMSIWKGIPIPVDAALVWDDKTYFFHNKHYYEFYDLKMTVQKGYPKLIAEDWLTCKDSPAGQQGVGYQRVHAAPPPADLNAAPPPPVFLHLGLGLPVLLLPFLF